MNPAFFTTGLPELPTNTDPLVEPDLRDSFNAIKNLALNISQQGGFGDPFTQYKNVANAAYTIGAYKRRLYVQAAVAITYGQLVNVYDSGAGVLKARLADATNNTKPAHGICNTAGISAIGSTIEIALPGAYINSVGGLVVGATYYTSTVPGALQNTPPSAAGNIIQAVGFAISPTEQFFNISSEYQIIPAANTAYVLTITASGGGFVLGNGTAVGQYTKSFENIVQVRAFCTFGNTTVFGAGVYAFSLPLPCTATTFTLGSALLLDTNTGNNFPATTVIAAGANTAAVYATGLGPLGPVNPAALAAGWAIGFSINYPV